MANTNGIASDVSKEISPQQVSDDLHRIATKLAGVDDALRLIVDDSGDAGNIVHLLAGVVAEANSAICISADRVSNFSKGGAA